MSQRVAGERARWLAAVLLVASIGATSVIVRIWPVEQAPAALTSRDIRLERLPPVPVLVDAARRPGAPPRKAPERRVQMDVAEVRPPESVPAVVEPVAAPEAAPQTVIPVDVDAVAADIDVPHEPADVRPTPAVDAAIETPGPVAVSPEGAAPAAAAPRGIAELPAVAVTRAVTIAGRGIMTGLKATTAILRAPF